MHKSFVVRRTWVLTLDLSLGQKEIDYSLYRLWTLKRFQRRAEQENNNLMRNLTIVYAIAATAARYLIILHVFPLHLSHNDSRCGQLGNKISLEVFISVNGDRSDMISKSNKHRKLFSSDAFFPKPFIPQ